MKLLIITAGKRKLCLDMRSVSGVYHGREHVTEMLLELIGGEDPPHDTNPADDSMIFPLNELLAGSAVLERDEQQLVVLAGNDAQYGLLVDTVSVQQDIAVEAVQALPPAFSKECREIFSEVVVLEHEGIPVITLESLKKLRQMKSVETA